MQFTGAVADLREAVDKAVKVTPSSTSEPIHLNVRLVTKGIYLNVEATDSRLAMQATIMGEGVEKGEVLIRAKPLLKILTGLEKRDPKGRVTVVADDARNVTLSMGPVKHTIPNTDDPKTFPVLSGLCLETPHVILSATDLQDTVKRLDFKSWCVIFEETKFVVRAKDKALRIVCTDKVQMAYNDIAFKGQDLGPIEDFVVPNTLLQRLAGLFDKGSEVLLRCDKEIGVMTVTSLLGALSVSARLSDKTFPNYEQSMPRDPAATIRLVATDLIQAMEDCAVVADENKSKVRLTFPNGADSMECLVSAENPETGKAESAVRIQGLKTRKAYSSEDWTKLSLNRKYLGRYLETLKKKAVEFNLGLTSPLYPMLCTVDELPGYVYVLMPINS